MDFLFYIMVELYHRNCIELLNDSGSWCMGIRLGNMDGWNGNYTIHILSAGILVL